MPGLGEAVLGNAKNSICQPAKQYPGQGGTGHKNSDLGLNLSLPSCSVLALMTMPANDAHDTHHVDGRPPRQRTPTTPTDAHHVTRTTAKDNGPPTPATSPTHVPCCPHHPPHRAAMPAYHDDGLPTAHHIVPRCTNTTTTALHPARCHPAQDTIMPEVRTPDRQGRWQRGGRQRPTDTVMTPHPCTAHSARAVHSNPPALTVYTYNQCCICSTVRHGDASCQVWLSL
ncbi:hypothetical protein BJ912DRAFT_934599 [Pholiota molesta]|nr:hypothetical protein BJ912DRAFT_934599 [Pholiota molesta]